MSAVFGTTAESRPLSPVTSRNTIWQPGCSGIRSCRSGSLARVRTARTIRSAWWKCRRRPMSNGASIGEDRPGLVPTASCGSPRTFSTCRPRRLRCCMSIAGQSRSSSGSSSMCWVAAIY